MSSEHQSRPDTEPAANEQQTEHQPAEAAPEARQPHAPEQAPAPEASASPQGEQPDHAGPPSEQPAGQAPASPKPHHQPPQTPPPAAQAPDSGMATPTTPAAPPAPGQGASTPGLPAATPSGATHSPTPSPQDPSNAPAISGQMEQEMEAAMQAATGQTSPGPGAPQPPAQQGGPSAPGAPTPPPPGRRPGIRGPRRVEGGREHRTGRVVSVGPDDLFLEFGPKELGVVGKAQWPEAETPKVDEQVEVVVDRFDAKEQIFLCSRPGAVQKAEWELLEPGQVVEARVTGVNKGGLELEVAGHRAFMPASQVDVRRVEDLSVFLNEKVRCKVKKVDRSGAGNIVLSRRDVVAVEQKEAKEKLKGALEPGQEVEGTVVRIMDFGAFVDIGGVDALCHISDLSHERVQKVEEVVKVGDTVRAKILKIDWGRDRISIGMKQTEPDPWDTAKGQVSAGDEISGRVTKAMDFGAFIEVVPGVEGLCHISELDWKRVPSVEAVVKPGQVVKAKVLEIDESKKRISLSVKATKEPPPSVRKKQEEEKRTLEEIRKETPAQRRMREKFHKEHKSAGEKAGLKSGLGESGGADLGDLGELRLG